MQQELRMMIVCILILGGAQSALAQTFEFKGIALGSQVYKKDLEEKYQLSCPNNMGPGATRFKCEGKTTFLGMNAYLGITLTHFSIDKGVVQELIVGIRNNSVWPKDMAAELSKKFGPPKRNQSNQIYDWYNSQRHNMHLEYTGITMTAPEIEKVAPPPTLDKKDL